MLKHVWGTLFPLAVPGNGWRVNSPEVRVFALLMMAAVAALLFCLVAFLVIRLTRRSTHRAALTRLLPDAVIVSVGFLSQMDETRTVASVDGRKVTFLSADAHALTLWRGGRTPVMIATVPWNRVQSVESGMFELVIPGGPFVAESRRYTAALYIGALFHDVPMSLPFAVYRDKRADHTPFILDGYALREVVDRIDDLRHAARATAVVDEDREGRGT